MSLKPTSQNPAIEFGVKSQLARLLATENIRIEHRPGVPTAVFDVKNRLLILPVWQNISEDLYDMLILHETAHAIDTPADGWINEIKRIAKKHHKNSIHAKMAEAAVKDFMNVIEDARIDKRQKRRYPGGKRNYVKGMAELHERDFFGIKATNKDINELNFIDRANIYFKGGTALGIKFDTKEQGYIQRMEEAETFEEVIQLTDELYEHARTNQQMMQSQTKISVVFTDGDGEDDDIDPDDLKDFDDVEVIDKREGKGGSGDDAEEGKEGKAKSAKTEDGEDGSNSSSSGEETDSDGKSSDTAKADAEKGKDKNEEVQADKSDDAEASDKDNKGDKKAKQVKKGKVNPFAHNADESYQLGKIAPDNYIPQVSTELAVAEKVKEIVLDLDANYVYVNTPKFNLENIVDDYKTVIPQMEKNSMWISDGDIQKHRNSLRLWKNREKDTVSYMVKEFEMRKAADIHSRITVAKTGVLDTNKLHSYKYNDDVFRRSALIPEGKNHGFVMILDWSGSMHEDLKHTMKQLFSLVLFCKRVQIPFEVYIFRDPCGYDNGLHDQWVRETGVLHFKNFKLRNVLSSRMNLSMLNRAMDVLWLSYANYSSDPMNGTPLNQALLVAHEIVNNFQKKNRVQIVSTIILTDGGSDNCLGITNEVTLPNKKGGSRYFLRDHVTGKVHPLNSHPRSGYNEATYLFTKILKERTQSNLVGFYLFNGSFSNLAYHLGQDKMNDEKMQKQWSSDGFVTCLTAGYDEYHILSVRKMGESKNELSVSGNMTQAAAVKAFTKFSEKKMVNRALLSAFIRRISDFKKNPA